MCLESVFAALKDIKGEVIVVDNNSTEDCAKLVRLNFPQVKLIENHENKGFSRAVNQGSRKAVGEYLLILNPDVIIPENSLKFILNYVKDQTGMGALGCRFIDGSGNLLPECKRNFPGMLAAAAKLFGVNAGYYADQLNDKENGEVEVLTGAFMFLKRDLFDQMTGFDEDFFMFGEDIDLSYRIHSSGFKNWYLGDVTVIHFKGESSIKDTTYLKHFYGALEIFFVKHFRHNVVSRALLRGLVRSAVRFRARSSPEAENGQTNPESFLYHGTREGVFEALKHKFGE
jgi:GT2 family glycosyltransferase